MSFTFPRESDNTPLAVSPSSSEAASTTVGENLPTASPLVAVPPALVQQAQRGGILRWILSGAEKLLYGGSLEEDPSVDVFASQDTGSRTSAALHEPVVAEDGVINNFETALPGMSTVVVEDPREVWLRRHAERISRHAVRENNISRFSQALFLHERGLVGGESRDDMGGEGGGVGGDAGGSAGLSDLILAIDAYQECPNGYYGSLVQALLSERSLPANPVTSLELEHAAGNDQLMLFILASGALDCTDTHVQAIVQAEIDSVIPFYLVENCSAEAKAQLALYLRSLFQVPSSTVSAEAVLLLENSGFEFVKLLHDFPKILRLVPPAPWWQLKPYEEHRTLDLFLAIVGLVLIVLDLVTLTSMAVQWWTHPTRGTFGYWTVLMAVGGYVVTLIVVVMFESSKVDSSMYDEMDLEYPSSNLKTIPLIPLLESILVIHMMRYYWLTKKEGKAFFVITHDLHASFSHLFILHSQCHSFPQILLQCYLFIWGSFETGNSDFLGFQIFKVTASASVVLSLLLYVRRIACYRSVNRAGFAVFGCDPKATFDTKGDFFPKVLAFLLIFMLEYNAFFLVVALTHVKECQTTVLIWIAIMGSILIAVFVIFVYMLVSGKSSSTTARLSLAPLLGQVGFAIYGSLLQATPKGVDSTTTSCAFYSISLGANVQVGIATFSVMLIVWSVWITVTVWTRYRHMDASLSTLQKFRYLFRITKSKRVKDESGQLGGSSHDPTTIASTAEVPPQHSSDPPPPPPTNVRRPSVPSPLPTYDSRCILG